MAEDPPEPLLTPADITATFWWMADVIAELREIHRLLEDEDGREEEDA